MTPVRMQKIEVESPSAASRVVESLLRNGCSQISLLQKPGHLVIQYAPLAPPVLLSPPDAAA